MLSSSAIKNVSQASHYFSEQDNYYSREEGMQQSEWWGRGAQKMQLKGLVDDKQFTQFLHGRLPTGEQLGKMVDGNIKHRPGWDLTFSAPKSVSIMALVGGDKRLLEAHRQAVGIALTHIEKGAAQARVKVNGEMTYENTGNLIGALYHHDLSRAKDPQLHTHSVVMNMTERSDGKWRSLASSIGRYNEKTTTEINGFIERIRHHNRYFSKIYEAELAFRVKELGYEINNDTALGIFEISDVPKELIEHFSKRRHEIEAMLEDKGLSGGKAAAVATLSTRDDKSKVDRDELHQKWCDEVKELGVDLGGIIDSTQHNNSLNVSSIDTPKIINEKAVTIIRDTAEQLAVFQSTFTLEQIITQASKEAISNHIDIKTLLNAARNEMENGNLLSIDNEQGKTILMAKSTLEDEKKLLSQLSNNQGTSKTVSDAFLGQFLAQHDDIPLHLHTDIHTVFNHDRVMLVEGEINKANLIPSIMKISKTARLEAVILSPSLAGGKQLAQAIQPQPRSILEYIKALFVDTTPTHYGVMQFLSKFEHGNPEAKKPDMLIVDNAHLLSTHQKANLVEWSNLNDSKLLLFGNKENLLPHQVSTSLKQLTDHGVKTIVELKKQEQSHHPISEPIQGKVTQLQDRIIEVTETDSRYHAMAGQYGRLSKDIRQSSWIATYSKANAEKLNYLVHEELTKNGAILKTISCKTLLPVFIQPTKATQASSYTTNQIVRFNDKYSSLSVQRGDYLRIIRISKQSNRIILQNENGERVVWKPDKVATSIPGKVEVFNEKVREIGVGESIVLQRSMKAKGLVKGERCHIESIYRDHVKLRDQQGKTTTIDLSKPYYRHIDYGYAASLHAIAHEKPNTLIADLPSTTLHTNQRRINQLVSQPSYLWLYTDDTKKLVSSLEKQTGNRLSAHDILKKSAETKASINTMYDVLEKELSKQANTKQSANLHKAIDAIEYAMKHLAERQAGFTHKDLMQVALKHAIGDVTEKVLSDVTLSMEKSHVLLRGHRNDGTLWTTAEAVKIEREIVALAQQDKGKMTPLANTSVIDKYLDVKTLRPEQSAAIQSIVMSSDRVLSIQGRAGTGKTTMMSSLETVIAAKELISDSGYTLRGIAPTHKAVKELSSRGIQAQTIDSFLLDMHKLQSNQQTHDFSKTILVIDEASMVSNRKMLDILKVAHENSFSRVIPTGDIHQNPAIEAGKPHDLIQRSLDNVIHLNDIQRQKNPILKSAALALYDGDIGKSFSLLDKCLIEIGEENHDKKTTKKLLSENSDINLQQKLSYEKRVTMLVKDYFDLLAKGEEVQIIAPSHADRKAINNEVRSKLTELGTLKGEAHSLTVFSSKDMTLVERTKATNFSRGDVVKFSASSGGIRTGDYLQINSIDKSHNLLLLTKLNGEGGEVVWQIPKSSKKLNSMVEVFKKENRELQVGDKIVWTRTNKGEGLISTELAEVTDISDKVISTKRPDNSALVFNANDPTYQHWDHSYALTTYSTQGGTYSTVLGLFESYRKNLMNLKTFLVTITRAVNNLRIYTDDKEALQSRVIGNHGNKLSSLEVIGEYPNKASIKPDCKPVLTINSPTTYRYDRPTIDKIVDGLNKDAEKIAIDLLGNPKMRGSNFIKFGTNQGSLSITTKGEREGWWNDFSEGKGGRSMLSFIQHHAGLNKQEALDYGAKRVGIYPTSHDKKLSLSAVDKAIKAEKQPNKNLALEKKQIEFVTKLTRESQPMTGTLVERYLKEQRAIDIKNHPGDIRFHPGIYSKLNGKTLPAMLVIARDHQGNIKAVQATYLDPDTATKIDKSQIVVQKQTFGVTKGSSVTIPGEKNSPTLLAEGIETGLSLKLAVPNATIKITLSKSNFKNIDVRSLSEKTVFCLDHDGKDVRADKTIFESAKRLNDANIQVAFMIPESINQQKQDYNDVLKSQGTQPIKNDFDHAISAQDFYGKSFNMTKVGQEAEKKIGAAAKLISANDQRNDKALTAAYHAMTKDSQRESMNIAIKNNDIERGI